MTRCYVCEQPATVRVEAQTLTGTTRYAACDDHDPRHIPQGDVLVIQVIPIR